MSRPMVLDLDGSIGPMDNVLAIDLRDWQARLRFGCCTATLQQFTTEVIQQLPETQETILTGSGDFHHLSWPLIARRVAKSPRPVRVVVLDNHPDNMRYLFGVHCGSWVHRVAALPQVSQVYVVGITSKDMTTRHAWEHYLKPLRTGKLRYWTLGVDTHWAQWLGLESAFRNFEDAESLTHALCQLVHEQPEPTYLSIDKDVFSPSVVHTNWDQGVLLEQQAVQIIQALAGQLIGSDITGEVSVYHHTCWWKRWLSDRDGQTLAISADTLSLWQEAQQALNRRLLNHLNSAMGKK